METVGPSRSVCNPRFVALNTYFSIFNFIGGTKANPTYYAMGDHTETIDLDFDPNVTSYAELLHIFWNNHDPCTKNKRQYMSAIFYHDEEQKELALQTKDEMSKKGKKITTEIAPAKEFTDAEE